MKSGTLGSTDITIRSGLLKSNRLPKDIQRTLVNEIAAGSKFKKVVGSVKTESILRTRLSKKVIPQKPLNLWSVNFKDQKIGPFAVVKKTPKKTTTTTTKKIKS